MELYTKVIFLTVIDNIYNDAFDMKTEKDNMFIISVHHGLGVSGRVRVRLGFCVGEWDGRGHWHGGYIIKWETYVCYLYVVDVNRKLKC